MPTDIYRAKDYGWYNLLTGRVETDFPTEANTGWEPTGTTLTHYTGPHFFSGETLVLEDKLYDEEILIGVAGANIILRRCEIRCAVDISQDATLYMEDCTVKAGNISNPAIGYGRMEIHRCNVQGGQHSIKGDFNTIVRDSILHKQYNDPDYAVATGYHNNAYITNGGGNIEVTGCTLDCSTVLTPNGGGPTGNLSLLPDFDVCYNTLIDNNLFLPTTGGFGITGGYDLGKPYGNQVHDITVTNNWFVRGPSGYNGAFGDYTSYKVLEPTNTWENNRHLDDHSLIIPV